MVKDTTIKQKGEINSKQNKPIQTNQLRGNADIERIDVGEVQAKKSTERMPWHWEPKKDVTSCDKLRGAANKLRSADFRMGKPVR